MVDGTPTSLGELRLRINALRTLAGRIENAQHFTDGERSRVHALITACEVRMIDLQARGFDDSDDQQRLNSITETLSHRERVLNDVGIDDAAVFEIFSPEHSMLRQERDKLMDKLNA